MSRKLTKDIILSRVGSDKLDSIKTLNLWGNNLDDISLISEMPSLEIISLSSNQIKDIKALKTLKNLKELYLKDNKISDFNQIEFLKNCKKLEILNLSENPISTQQNYRQKILDILPNLKKLDDLENNNFQHSKFSFHKNPFMLFKKIFPKRTNNTNNTNKINDLNASVNIDEVNNHRNTVNNPNSILNKSFQKKKNLGTFKKIGNKKFETNKNLNLDLSLDYSKNNYKLLDPNKSTNFEEYGINNTEANMINNKYNKKIVGNYKQLSHVKNYQSTMLSSYQEFDEPVKNEKKEKNSFDNNRNNAHPINEKIKINEDIVLQSIKLLLDVLNASELNCVNEDIKNLLKEKNM